MGSSGIIQLSKIEAHSTFKWDKHFLGILADGKLLRINFCIVHIIICISNEVYCIKDEVKTTFGSSSLRHYLRIVLCGRKNGNGIRNLEEWCIRAKKALVSNQK